MTSDTIRTITSTARIILMAYVDEGNMFFLGGGQFGKRRKDLSSHERWGISYIS